MIIIKDLNTGKKIDFQITKFPDGTSQIWKLLPEPEVMGKVEVIWMFQNETELISICQLGDLLSLKYKVFPTLNVPWMPYSRQDKRVANQSTFARTTFLNMVYESGYSRVKTYDSHSYSALVDSMSPEAFHKEVIKHELVCFPDLGATTRYPKLKYQPHIWFHKVRDQSTGQIQGLVLEGNPDMIEGKTVAVVDDLCDGGATFIGVINELKKYNAKSVDLVVSHGVFSKGTKILFDAGFNQIYTTNSLLGTEQTPGILQYEIIDIYNNLDYNDLRRQERKLV